MIWYRYAQKTEYVENIRSQKNWTALSDLNVLNWKDRLPPAYSQNYDTDEFAKPFG